MLCTWIDFSLSKEYVCAADSTLNLKPTSSDQRGDFHVFKERIPPLSHLVSFRGLQCSANGYSDKPKSRTTLEKHVSRFLCKNGIFGNLTGKNIEK